MRAIVSGGDGHNPVGELLLQIRNQPTAQRETPRTINVKGLRGLGVVLFQFIQMG